MSHSVRISDKSRKTLHSLATKTGVKLSAMLDELIEAEHRRRFFQEFDQGYGETTQRIATSEQQAA